MTHMGICDKSETDDCDEDFWEQLSTKPDYSEYTCPLLGISNTLHYSLFTIVMTGWSGQILHRHRHTQTYTSSFPLKPTLTDFYKHFLYMCFSCSHLGDKYGQERRTPRHLKSRASFLLLKNGSKRFSRRTTLLDTFKKNLSICLRSFHSHI